MSSRILFVEPPKDYWFVMGEYLPPPTVLLILAAYLERELPDIEIEILDCQAQRKSWKDIEVYIESFSPWFVAFSGFTCNAYACARVAEIAKKVNSEIVTIAGGLHFSQTPEESLLNFPEIDYIVRGEGEQTLVELIKAIRDKTDITDVKGLSFSHNGKIIHTPTRPLIENLDSLPYPAYHLVEDQVKNYHFSMMAGKNTPYVVMEGARGCVHRCSFCTQWKHWNGMWRSKSAKRIADEIQYLHEKFGGQFIWFTDDNFDYRKRGKKLWKEIKSKKFSDDLMLFFQARTDDVTSNPDLVAKFREVGNYWVMMGVESHSEETLLEFKKGIKIPDAYKAIKILNENDIFSHAMFVIGSRKDTRESIKRLRDFSMDLGSDFSIYTVLTPYPGTEYYENAKKNGWIADTNFANYDMAHAIMPTETLSRKEVQEELYKCYRERYGSITKNIAGVFSKKKLKRNLYRHYARQKVLTKLRRLI
ncbi:MAG: radical SAM protein [Methanomassiliicoccales archaeon]|nr:MAG: radical SAM protein [Methanomassiliicoccales archaeon]